MKAVTRQRPKNANYSVSSNPTHTNGAPLKTRPKPRGGEKAQPPSKGPSGAVRQLKQPSKERDDEHGGIMTKFRSLDDIPDFSDDFGKNKVTTSPINNVEICHHAQANHDTANEYPSRLKIPSSNQQKSCPPPLPAESLMHQSATPESQNNNFRSISPDSFSADNQSSNSIETDPSDDDNFHSNHSKAYFSSKDDHQVDYTPSKIKTRKEQRTEPSARSVQSNVSRITSDDCNKKSKQPVEITYKPYTLQQYRKIKPQEYVEFGKLKPDLNTSELIAKRANAERIKQFSKNLHEFNKANIKQGISADEKLALRNVKAPSKRDKALQFAQNVPKPKVNVPKANDNVPKRNVGVSVEKASKLDELTSRHQQSRKQVEAIKKSMGL